jgi:hypothetical protein
MITIFNGFLELHHPTGEVVSVKGSAIVCVQETSKGSLVTIGCNGWSIGVTESRGEILTAIAESYKQAARR